MDRGWGSFSLELIALCLLSLSARAQTDAAVSGGMDSYRMSVAVDEVSLTFHADDAQGRAIDDLKLDEVRLLDDGRAPRRILKFQLLRNFPLRAAILMDMSASMMAGLAADRAIAVRYAERVLRQKTDVAFVMNFGYVAKIVQPWTSDAAELAAGVGRRAVGGVNPRGGTALFDTLDRVCRFDLGGLDSAAGAKFVLLFSDGEDTASHASLQQAANTCQRANVAIYVFRTRPAGASTGPAALAELTAQTGGRVFAASESEADVDKDLQEIEGEMRNQYRIVYRPAELKHDGAFHRIDVLGSDRVAKVTVRSGYYAPGR